MASLPEIDVEAKVPSSQAKSSREEPVHSGVPLMRDFQMLMDAYAAVDMTGRFTEYNESFRVMLAYDVGELDSLHFFDITPDKWRELEARIIDQEVLVRGWSDLYDKEFRRKDGSIVPVAVRITLLRDEAGEPFRMCFILRDITRRVQVEQALRQSELRYRELIEKTSDLVLQTDGDGKIVYVNQTAKAVFGCGPEECTGRIAAEFIHPEDLARTNSILEDAIRNRQKLASYENRSVSLTGELHYLLWAANLDYDERGLVQINAIARDITERKRSELALRESESFLKAIVDNVPFEFWARDLEERCTMQNQALVKHWGNILGLRPEHSAITPEELAIWKSNNRRAFAGEIVKGEIQYTIQGEQRYFYEIVAPFRVDNEIRGILGFNLDITERKHAEQELERAKEFSDQLIRTANALVVGLDNSGKIRIFNETAEKWTGYTREEVLGRNWFDLMLLADVREEVVEEFKRLIEGIARDTHENTIVTKSGEHRLISFQNSQITENGVVVGTISFGIDITDSRRAEQRIREREEIFRYIIKFDPNAVAVFDRKLRYIAASDRFLADYNVKEADVIGRPHYEVFPEMPQKWKEVHQRCLLGAVEGNPDDSFQRPDGSITYNRWQCRPWYWSNGEIGGIVLYSEVTTERKLAEIALRNAKDEVERVNRELEQKVSERTAQLRETINELEQFSYALTHDLRAPLRAIQGFARLIEEESGTILPASSKEYLRRMVVSTERMDHLVEDSLNYGKILLGDYPLEPVNITDLIHSIIQSDTAFQPPQAEVTLKGEIPRVLGYSSGLIQSITHLLRNAVKFVAPGVTPKVRIWGEERGEWVRIWLQDNGIGIARDYHQRIFGMFQQLDRRYGGTGIGLAVVRKTVERMGGNVGVESELGQGSRFWIDLKRAP